MSLQSDLIIHGEVADDVRYRTLYESKGLEFNDVRLCLYFMYDGNVLNLPQVLLYNFFADSHFHGRDWQALLKFSDDPIHRTKIPEQGLLTEVNRNRHLDGLLINARPVEVPIRRRN